MAMSAKCRYWLRSFTDKGDIAYAWPHLNDLLNSSALLYDNLMILIQVIKVQQKIRKKHYNWRKESKLISTFKQIEVIYGKFYVQG